MDRNIGRIGNGQDCYIPNKKYRKRMKNIEIHAILMLESITRLLVILQFAK